MDGLFLGRYIIPNTKELLNSEIIVIGRACIKIIQKARRTKDIYGNKVLKYEQIDRKVCKKVRLAYCCYSSPSNNKVGGKDEN